MRVVLTGASGQLGPYVASRLIAAGHDVRAWSGKQHGERAGLPLRPVDLAEFGQVEKALAADDPAAVIHCGAVSTADAARRDPDHARAVNVGATALIAEWCSQNGRKLVYTSTDLVFDGARSFYSEDHPTNPVLTYGLTKRDAEPAVRAVPGGLVARTSLMFGPSRSGGQTYLDRAADGLKRGAPQTYFEDEYRTPLDLDTAGEAIVRLAGSDASGTIHVAGAERMSRFELVRRFAVALGLDASLVRANRQADATFPEPRPADVSLDTTRLMAAIPDLIRPSVEEASRALWLNC